MSEEFDFDAALARMTSQTDQAIQAVGDLAKIVYAYYQGLIGEGFSREEALGLTYHYQAQLIPIFYSNPPDDQG